MTNNNNNDQQKKTIVAVADTGNPQWSNPMGQPTRTINIVEPTVEVKLTFVGEINLQFDAEVTQSSAEIFYHYIIDAMNEKATRESMASRVNSAQMLDARELDAESMENFRYTDAPLYHDDPTCTFGDDVNAWLNDIS